MATVIGYETEYNMISTLGIVGTEKFKEKRPHRAKITPHTQG